MVLNNELQNPLTAILNPSQIASMNLPLANVESMPEDENKNFNLSNLLVNDENNLTTIEQAKKGIIGQVFNQIFGNQEDNKEGLPLYPSLEFEMHNFAQEQTAEYNQESLSQTPYGFLYESSDEFYQKTTIDFSASAVINTPNGKYEIEINFQYTQELYERHSTAIGMNHEAMKNNPLEINLDRDDDSLKGIDKFDFLFDLREQEQIERENEKNAILMKFLQSLFEKSEQQQENALQNNFYNEIAVYERRDESFELAAQTQNGVGMYFSHEKSEAAYMQGSYDSNGNFSFEAGYSSYESTQFALKV